MTWRTLVDTKFRSTSENVSAQIASLGDLTTQMDGDQSQIDNLKIVLAEVLNNIVEHAYGEGRDGLILLRAFEQDGTISIETRDQGRPLPAGQLPSGAAPSLDVDPVDLPEGGFGWFLIHTLTDDMVYERDSGENRLTFTIAA